MTEEQRSGQLPLRATRAWSEEREQLYQEITEEVLKGLESGDTKPLFDALCYYGPRVLVNLQILAEVEFWWGLKDGDFPRETQDRAREDLTYIGKALASADRGKKSCPQTNDKRVGMPRIVSIEQIATTD